MLSLEEIALDLTVMVSSMGGRAPVFG